MIYNQQTNRIFLLFSGLQAEIERLRNEMAGMPDNNELIKSSNAEIASLRNKLQQKELEMNEMTK
jgi:hypothetical protein